MNTTDFSQRLVRWQKQYGRHGLPWQVRNPYAIWLSEIMLQQTQVATVLEYYPRFLAAFPSVKELAAADEDEVLAQWAGLGYYSRARNLHAAAKQVMQDFGGQFPGTRAELETLKGVGRSTAAAIAAFAFGRRETILDGNVKRVLCRVFAQDGMVGDKKFEAGLWALAESLLPLQGEMIPYTQGLMDLGAMVCKRSKPLCRSCPMADICLARLQGRIAELPRKKAALPVKEVALYWLVLRDRQGRVWLEKRPAGGIWGGLHCVPCLERLDEIYTYAADFGVDAGDLAELPVISHRLTHRLLHITPLQADGVANGRQIGGVWAEAGEYGLPKPLSAYLQRS